MRFFGGPNNPYRILTAMRPHTLCGSAHYLMARWRYDHDIHYSSFLARSKPPKGQRGGWWNRLRINSLVPMRRVINPAIRYEKVTRQCNEIRQRRYKYDKSPGTYLWAKRYPKRTHS